MLPIHAMGEIDGDLYIATRLVSATLRNAITIAPDPVFVSDLEGRILQANEAVSELLGFRQDELLEQAHSQADLIPQHTRRSR